jgi:hypothetical protein
LVLKVKVHKNLWRIGIDLYRSNHILFPIQSELSLVLFCSSAGEPNLFRKFGGRPFLGLLSQINPKGELLMSQTKVVKYSRSLKRISLQRFLISKIVYEKEKVSLDDVFALYDNQVWLERKCFTDFYFSEKFGNSLEELSSILKEANLSRGLTNQTLSTVSEKCKIKIQGFLVPKRNYPDFKRRFCGLFSIRTLPPPSEANKHIPQKRFIGIGYRDKGTAKEPAKDGSPSWQDIASRGGQIKLGKEMIRNARTITDIARGFEVLGLISQEELRSFKGNPRPPKKT